jgi:hypothetical protein
MTKREVNSRLPIALALSDASAQGMLHTCYNSTPQSHISETISLYSVEYKEIQEFIVPMKVNKKIKTGLLVALLGASTLFAVAPSYAYEDYYYSHGYYHHYSHHSNGDAVAAGFLGAAVGLMAGAAIAHSSRNDDYYYSRHHYTSKRCYYNGFGDRVCRTTNYDDDY